MELIFFTNPTDVATAAAPAASPMILCASLSHRLSSSAAERLVVFFCTTAAGATATIAIAADAASAAADAAEAADAAASAAIVVAYELFKANSARTSFSGGTTAAKAGVGRGRGERGGRRSERHGVGGLGVGVRLGW